MRSNKLTTWQQFEKDFGHFPPKGLSGNVKLKEHEFFIVQTNKYKEFLKSFKMPFLILLRLIKNDEKGLGLEGNKKAIISIEKFEESKYKMKQMLLSWKDSLRSKSIMKKLSAIGGFLLILLLSPALFLVFSFFSLMAYFLVSFKIYISSKTTLGYHLKVEGESEKIFLNSKLIEKISANVDELVTHEHMHLRQERVKYEKPPIDTVFSYVDTTSRDFIVESLRNKSRTEYMTDRLEVEVRLNELMICHYQANEFIPDDYTSFMKMFLGYEPIYILINHTRHGLIKKFKIEKNELRGSRGHRSLYEIFDLLVTVKNEDYLEKYITQVLPVMYSHLLFYYGDEKACKRFFDTIPSKEMFYDMYGGNIQRTS